MDNNDPNNPNQNIPTDTPPQPTQPSPSPWETPVSAPGAQPTTPIPLPDSPWPSSTNTTDPAMSTPAPQSPGAPNPFASNPFLQPQAPQEDSLNTAFASAPNPNETNPFNSTIAPTEPPASAIPEIPMQPAQPTLPIPDFLNPAGVQTPIPPQNPIPEMTNPAPPQLTDNPQIPASNQPGTLDLSSLQAGTTPAPNGTPAQSGNPLPEMGSIENAPTDLSHLIAGDETNQQPGDIYNPPVASDHNLGLNSTQPQAPSEDGAFPTEKHLNLTKVLLVAGIPIILIVAALSAYLILGVGKSSPKSTTNQTSLPVEQSQPQQAPLTNPPQQIVAPAPSSIPQQTPAASPASATLPVASSSPTSALEQLKARQSASPSPNASTTTTLP